MSTAKRNPLPRLHRVGFEVARKEGKADPVVVAYADKRAQARADMRAQAAAEAKKLGGEVGKVSPDVVVVVAEGQQVARYVVRPHHVLHFS